MIGRCVECRRPLNDTGADEVCFECWSQATDYEPTDKRNADRVDGFDRDDLGESPDY
jgi:hypothetical protein